MLSWRRLAVGKPLSFSFHCAECSDITV